MLRRKRMPDELHEPWDAFRAQAARVEDARQALLGCLPVGRVEPAPVPFGLDLLREELEAVAAEMDRWKVDAVAEHWDACHDAVAKALARIGPARELAAATEELHDVLDAVAGIVGTLDAWHDAERFWLSLRVRS